MKAFIKGKMYLGLLMVIAASLWLAGCSASKDDGDKVRDLDFTVAGDLDVPDELKKLIAGNSSSPSSLHTAMSRTCTLQWGMGCSPLAGTASA